MIEITISSEFKKVCPDFVGVAVYASVVNAEYNQLLWNKINDFTKYLTEETQIEDIKKVITIAATRDGYKKCGKDPGRYRPAAEALRRRIMKGLPLYQINTLVDLVNLISLQTGYSIGGFDADKIQGQSLVLGLGKVDEPYEGIGRGIINIESLPVYRDNLGGVGTPTSDNERTKIELSTHHILVLINAYDGMAQLSSAVDLTKQLLLSYACASNVETMYFQ